MGTSDYSLVKRNYSLLSTDGGKFSPGCSFIFLNDEIGNFPGSSNQVLSVCFAIISYC